MKWDSYLIAFILGLQLLAFMSKHKQPSILASFAKIARLDTHLPNVEPITIHEEGVPDPPPSREGHSHG